jgi:prolyl oligopeptidase
MSTITYPATKKVNQVDDYYGTKVPDPYRWLEDDNADDTKAWVIAQNNVTFDYLEKIPYRHEIKNRLTELWNYERFSAPFKKGDFYYYSKNNGLQNQSVLFKTPDLSQEGEVFLDPNILSSEGTAALGAMAFSNDGKYLAYVVNEAGSDWGKIYIMNAITHEKYDESLEWIKFSNIAWQGNGFYYSRYPKPEGSALSNKNEYHAIYYHTIGTTQNDDVLIYVDKMDAQRNAGAMTTEDEAYLIITTSESTSGNGFKLANLHEQYLEIKTIIDDFKYDYSVIDSIGEKLYIKTNDNAPKQRVMVMNANNPARENWRELVPESIDLLAGANIVGNKLFLNYMHNASSIIKVYDMEGIFITDIMLPGIGSSGGISGKVDDVVGYYSFTSFTKPTTIYALDTNSFKSTVFKAPLLKFESDNYETIQEWVKSKDGTQVPIFITMKKGTVLDGSNLTLLYGYGGFDISLTPSYTITKLPLLEQGGIYVLANLRGGGEFGSDWHKDGTLLSKQNVFDDFIAISEYLIERKYTSKSKLGIQGGSNGGLLVGAAMTQRPDLYAVALPAVGVLDMLRYHLFTIGWAWAKDYGRSDESIEMFQYLLKYSPLHNIQEEHYPATLITTGDHDDRVVPAHSFKFAAELQSYQQGLKPILIRIETSGGHGAGKPTTKVIEEAADILAFLFYNAESEYNS